MDWKLSVVMLLSVIVFVDGAIIQKGEGDLIKIFSEQNPKLPIGDDGIVSLGSFIEIDCPVYVPTEELASVNWEFNESPLVFEGFNTVGYPNIRRYTETILIIYSITENNAGEYTCVLIDPRTKDELDRASSNLEVANECDPECQGLKGEKDFEGKEGIPGDSMGEQTGRFTRAIVRSVVIEGSQFCGQTRTCVECKCIRGELQQCEESDLCVVSGLPPILQYTSGNFPITQDNMIKLVGGYGPHEERASYELDGDLVSRFTINSNLREGARPVHTSWYYVDVNGDYIPIEQSPVANYASVSTTNPYNLIFSQVGDNIQGTYVLVAENKYGTDTQFTTIELCRNETVLIQSCDPDKEPGVDIIVVLDVTTAMETVNEFIFNILLPSLEEELNRVCIGRERDEEDRNEYTVTRTSIGSMKTGFIRDHFTFSPDNLTNLTNVYSEVMGLTTDTGGRGVYGAVKRSLNNERLRQNKERIILLSTDKNSDMSIYPISDRERESYLDFRNFPDKGRSLFTAALKDKNPIVLVDTDLRGNTAQNETYECVGVSNLLQCYYQRNGSESLARVRASIDNAVKGKPLKNQVHKDFVLPSLNAGGFVWDVNAIKNGGMEERRAMSDSIIQSVVSRIRVGACHTCRCYQPRCSPLSLTSDEQERCQCEQINGAESCDCLKEEFPSANPTCRINVVAS